MLRPFRGLCACLGLFLAAACAPVAPETSGQTYDDFPETCRLQAELVPIDTVLFRYPFRVRVQGDRAAVLDLHGSDHFVHLFTYPGFRYVASCGRLGEGPEETLSGENIRWQQGLLQLLDANKSELTCWQETERGDSLVRRQRIKLDGELLRALDFVQTDDSTFLIPDYSGNSRFCVVNAQGRLLRRWGTLPVSDPDAMTEARPAWAQVWRSFIDYRPDNGVLAAATQLGEVLELWNLRDSTHVVLRGPGGEPEFTVSEGYGIPTGIMGFSEVQVGRCAVYAVFQGHRFKDIMQAARQGKPVPDGGKWIYVFSLTGEPLVKYELDRYVHGIAVDEENGILIATDVQSDEPIVRYRLP